MSIRRGKVPVEAYPADRDRLNQMAADLTATMPGRFGQADTLKLLLDQADAARYIISLNTKEDDQ